MIRSLRLPPLFLIAIVLSSTALASAFVAPSTNPLRFVDRIQSRTTAILPRQTQSQCRGFDLRYDHPNGRLYDTHLYNKLLDFLSPYESKIPEELREEIYQAEANTAAARDRGTRVALYTLLAISGIALASFNGFLTDMRDKESAMAIATAATTIPDTGNNLYILEQNGFGWVLSNPIFKFLFTNKIGGVLTLLFAGGSGIMAEVEFDTKRVNAEKIYEELERRREQKLKKQTGGKTKSKNKSKKKKKGQSGKQKKRLAAISEVVLDDVQDTTTESVTKSVPPVGIPLVPPNEIASTDTSAQEEAPGIEETGNDEKKGVFGKMKELYEKADSMAASQALIMNKNLEEAGMIEKITDETGLKVIGREEAKKLEEKNSEEKK